MNGRTELAIDYINHYYLSAIEELFGERETSYWDEYVLDTFKRVCDKFNQGLLEDPYVVRPGASLITGVCTVWTSI